MAEPQAALAWCPFPDREAAQTIARVLLKERLIACANIMPGIESVFEWNGECSSAEEFAVLFKTSSDKLVAMIARLGQLHPYDTPAIVGWRCDHSHSSTLSWLDETLNRVHGEE